MPVDSRRELDGSPNESRNGFQFEATRRFICDWDDRYYCRGLLVDWPGEVYPYSLLFGARCMRCGIEPAGVCASDGAGGVRYRKAILTAIYESPKPGQPVQDSNPANPTEIVSEELEPFVTYETVDPYSFRWKYPFWTPVALPAGTTADPDGSPPLQGWQWVKKQAIPPEQAPGIPQWGIRLVVTRHNVALPLPFDFLALMNTCNQTAVRSRVWNLNFPAETLMYSEPRFNVSIMSDGSRKCAVTMKYTFKQAPGWNWFKLPTPVAIAGNPNPGYSLLQRLAQAAPNSPPTWQDYKPVPPADWSPILPP